MDLNSKSPNIAIIERNEYLLFQISERATQGYFDEFRFNLNDYTKVFCRNENFKKEHYLKKFEECRDQLQSFGVYPVEVGINDFTTSLNFSNFREYSILINYSNEVSLQDQIFYGHGEMKTGPELIKIYQNLGYESFLINILFPSIDFYYYKYLLDENEIINKSLQLSKTEIPEYNPIITNPEEFSSPDEKNKLKDNQKYFNTKGENFTLAQVALFIIYKKYKTNLFDPRSTSDTVFHKLAIDFGFESKTSANQLFQEWNKRKNNNIERLGQKLPINVKKDLEEILSLLDPIEKKEAENDINLLNLKIENY